MEEYKGLTKELMRRMLDDVLMQAESEKRQFTLYTGYGGMMMFEFKMRFWAYGKKKLPRKMKKRIFGTKKDRLQYLPEYYLKVKPKKGRNY